MSQTAAWSGRLRTVEPSPCLLARSLGGHTCFRLRSWVPLCPVRAACTLRSKQGGCGSWQRWWCHRQRQQRARCGSSAAPWTSWNAPGLQCPTAGSVRDNTEVKSCQKTSSDVIYSQITFIIIIRLLLFYRFSNLTDRSKLELCFYPYYCVTKFYCQPKTITNTTPTHCFYIVAGLMICASVLEIREESVSHC